MARGTPSRARWMVFAAAGLVVAGLAWQQHALEREITARARVDEPTGVTTIEVARAIAAMDLVTVRIDTSVSVQSEDESWRGDVTAQVSCPARLSYGVDLSSMRAQQITQSPASGEWIVRIPPPKRLATEVYPEVEDSLVRVGWLRFRTQGGEYHLSRARQRLAAQARAMRLTPDDARLVERESKERVSELVQKIVGPASVVVIVDEQLASGGTPTAVPEDGA